MLFKVSHPARPAADPTAEPITLHPQFEADDEAGARAKHSQWLADTGYALLEGAELVFELLADTGFDPDVQKVASLEDQVADLKKQLAAAGDAPAKIDALNAQLQSASDALAAAKAQSSSDASAISNLNAQLVTSSLNIADLTLKLNAFEQTVADKDSELTVLKAQLEEALTKLSAAPAASPSPDAPAASAPDGSTPPTP